MKEFSLISPIGKLTNAMCKLFLLPVAAGERKRLGTPQTCQGQHPWTPFRETCTKGLLYIRKDCPVRNPIAEARGLPLANAKTCTCWADSPRLARSLSCPGSARVTLVAIGLC